MSLESFVEEIPEAYYRKAIDLNRYSNSVARELMQSYERIIRRSIAELERIEQMPSAKRPQVRAQRLKALIKQNTEALARWSDKAGQQLARELGDLAKIEVDFTVGQLRRGVPDVAKGAVRTVEVTPAFAEAVITADPTNVGTAVLSDSLEEIVSGPAKAMKLTARQGAAIRMPDGRSIGKAFRGLAEQQAQIFATTVQDGLLSGESTQAIARTLIGEGLEFSTKAKSIRQLAQAGGQMTKMATHQVRTLVRTSVNATSNVASQRVYRANPTVTKRYRWLATLDEKTSPICKSLDQQVFEYGKGPTPASPPHFNCRSTTVPVVDWDGLSSKYGIDLTPPRSRAKRPSATGGVPLGTSYGKWLHDQRPAGKKFEASAAQAKAFGGGKDTPGARLKAKYFNRLADKYGPDKAMKKFLREDGTEVSLGDLKSRYGEPERITATKTKAKAKPKTKPKTAAAAAPKPTPKAAAPRLDQFNQQFVESPELAGVFEAQGGSGKFMEKLFDRLEGPDEVGANVRKMREFMQKNGIVNHFVQYGEDISKTAANYSSEAVDKVIRSQQATVKAAKRLGWDRQTIRITEAGIEELKKGDRDGLEFLMGAFNKPGVGGWTRQSQGIVVTHMQGNEVVGKRISLLKNMKDSLEQTLEYTRDNKGRLPWSTSGDAKEQSWITTMFHEVGHQVHYRGLNAGSYLNSKHFEKGGLASVSQYGLTNEKERFAEAFVQYTFNPEGLKKHAPGLYSWVEEAREVVLK